MSMLLRTKNTAFENETRCAKQVRRVGDNKKDCTITAQSLSFYYGM